MATLLESKQEVWKINTINLAVDHRSKCDPTCAISLCTLREMAEVAGVKFTVEERKLFI